MPKGRMPILGSGPFVRVRLPKPGDEPKTEDEKKLQELDAIKNELLDELDKRSSTAMDEPSRDTVWEAIIAAVGTYLGQKQRGLPPTEAERDKILGKIERAASKLEDEITHAPVHVISLLNSAMLRRDGNLYELKKHLDALSGLSPISQILNLPQGRPDPFAEGLIRELVAVWKNTTGKWPGKTGEDNYKRVRTSPFFRWISRISEVGIGKGLSRELIDTTISLSKPDG